MGAVDGDVVRQGGQLPQAGPHLLRRTLEEAATAEREQGVADEGHVVDGVVEGDVAQGVAAGVDHLEAGLSQPDDIALVDHPIGRRADALDLGRADDDAAGFTLQPRVSAGVVGVPVGVEHQVQRPAQLAELGQDGVGVGRVDTGCLPRRTVAHKKAVVVGEAGKLVDGDGHGAASLRPSTRVLRTLLRMT